MPNPIYCTHFQELLMIEMFCSLNKVLLLKPHFQHLKESQFQNRELILGVLRIKGSYFHLFSNNVQKNRVFVIHLKK